MLNMATTTFETQTLKQRAQKFGRLFRRLQYPLSESSEPMFDLERYGASSRHSDSTRRSISTFRRGMDEAGMTLSRSETYDPEMDKVDIVVVDRLVGPDSDCSDRIDGIAEKHTTARGSEHGTAQDDDQRQRYGALAIRVYHSLQHFFYPVFQDPKKEAHYQKESWFLAKRVAIWISIFYYVSWMLILGLYPRPWHMYDYIAWLGIVGLFVLPLLPAVLLDVPKRFPYSWHIFLFFTTWVWSFLMIGQLVRCHFYVTGHSTCGQKDFVGLFFYLVAMPTMALFALQQSRLLHLIGTMSSFIFISIVIVPLRHLWIRHLFNFFAFQLFILYISYAREKTDRKIFNLRDQLKVQYKATQKAQVAESKASDSKKRFFNYIFHEVRVPLNTALLSLQNLVGEEVFRDAPEDSLELVDVLQSSLGMMEKVLNDVLDFHRSSEAGKLTCASAPFDFTKVIRSVLMGLDVAAVAKDVAITSHLDPRIEMLGELVGDEMRLRQVLSNLTSNACKFTSSGGSVSLTTKLISPLPTSLSSAGPDSTVEHAEGRLSSETIKRYAQGSARSDTTRVNRDRTVTIRMEIRDTGVGIRASDVKNDKLFSPYVQTEIGKRQGGKGTGLGLALVRNIIELSGGRLGLQSQPGEGSTFWVEQQFDLLEPSKLQILSHSYNTQNLELLRPSIDKFGSKLDVGAQISVLEQKTISVNTLKSDVISPVDIVEVVYSERPTLPATPPPTTSTIDTLGSLPPESASSRPQSLASFEQASTENHQSPEEAHHVQFPADMPARASATLKSVESIIPKIKPAVPRDDGMPLHILVIDDDLLTRRLMTRMLTRLGHSVESTENGLLALEIIRKHWRGELGPTIDLIFCDNQMPVLSGVEMVNLARMEGIDTMLCGVTGNAMQEDQDEFIDCGADHVLIKPVLELNVKKMIELAQQRRAGKQDLPQA